jgi:Bacterial Ig-like domain (group 1)/Family of unknown function (DUF6519)
MYGDYSRGHAPDRKRGRSYRRVLLQMGRPLLDSDVAAGVDAVLGEIQAAARSLGCAAASADLGFLVTPGRLLVLFAEALDGLTVTQGTPNAWLDYRHRFAERYPALHLSATGTDARVTLPLLQELDPDTPAHAALWMRVEKAATIHVNGIAVPLTPGTDPARVEFDATAAAPLDPVEIEIAAGDEAWLYLLEQGSAAGADPTFSIAPGTYSLDGLTVDAGGGSFPEVAFPSDEGFPWTGSPPHMPPLDGLLAADDLAAGTRLVAYLEAWERPITAVEDPGIKEEALGSTDTTTRAALVGQVKLATLTGSSSGGAAAAPVLEAAFRDVEVSGGRLTISVPETTPTTDPCALPELAGYSGPDNRLYRAEVHLGGGLSEVLLKWSRDNGSDLFAARVDSGGNLVFDAGTPLAAGDIVEVLTGVIDLGDDMLASVGSGGFVPSQRAVGQLAQLADVDVASSSDQIVFELADLSDGTPLGLDDRYGTLDSLKLRRWTGVLDPGGSAGPHTLEDGLTVELSSTGSYRPGQYWQYEARVVGANANGPWRSEPHGPERRFAPLALLEYNGATEPLRLLAWLDERFSHPCDVDADGIAFAGGRVGSASDTVQEAIEELFERPDKSGSCTVTVGPGDDLAGAIASLPADGGELCFQAGLYPLTAPLTITGRKRIVVHGAGPSTILRATASEAALVFDNCSEIAVRTLCVEGALAKTAAGREHLNGAITFTGGGEISVAGCSLICPDAQTGAKGGLRSGQTCLTARGGTEPLRIRVERNDIQVGMMQAGVLLVDPAHAFVAGNVVRVAGAQDLLTGNVADEGIVVAGTDVGTVELLDNLVEQTIQGIHVAASGPAAGRESADAVLLSRNVVHSRVPAAHKRARHAVFIGNAHSVHVKDTIATLERTGSGAATEVDAIRLHGVFGPFLDVSQTSVRNFNIGVRVEPLDPVPSPRMWLVSETMADGGVLGADAPDTVEQERNYPLHHVVASLALSPPGITRNVGAQHMITATAHDASGLPVKGVNVLFSVSGVNHQAATPVATDANGIASFTYVGANVGHDTISAFADSNGNGKQDANEPSTLASVDFLSAAPTSISLSQLSGTSARGAVVTVTATALTAQNAPAPDARVVFTVAGANPQPAKAVMTNSAGQAVFSYMGGNAGTDTINAFVDLNANNTRESNEPQATALTHTVEIVAQSIQLLPSGGVANEGTKPVFNATVRDPAGAPIAGVVVRFSVTGANPATGSGTTNANGVVSFAYPAAATVGNDVITAFADVNNNNTRDANEPQTQSTLSVLHVQPQTTVVPDITGLLRGDAVDALTAADLRLGTVTPMPDPPKPPPIGGGGDSRKLMGPYVFDHTPAAGAVVPRQSSVNVRMRKEWDTPL